VTVNGADNCKVPLTVRITWAVHALVALIRAARIALNCAITVGIWQLAPITVASKFVMSVAVALVLIVDSCTFWAINALRIGKRGGKKQVSDAKDFEHEITIAKK